MTLSCLHAGMNLILFFEAHEFKRGIDLFDWPISPVNTFILNLWRLLFRKSTLYTAVDLRSFHTHAHTRKQIIFQMFYHALLSSLMS